MNIVATTVGRAYLPNNIGVPSAAVANAIANAAVRFDTVDETGLIRISSRSRRLAFNAQINALMVMWGVPSAGVHAHALHRDPPR